MTLDDLKAENAAAVNQEPEVNEQEVEQVIDEPEAEEVEAESEAQAEADDEWLKSDSQAVPLSKHVEVKHKLKARLSEKDDELARLRAENEQLKAGGVMTQQPQQQVTAKVPKLSDYDYDEEKYAEAMAQYTSSLVESRLSGYTSNAQAAEQQRQAEKQREQALDSHYERAAQLVETMGGRFTADTYKEAERNFRSGLHEVTGNGDMVADEIIARLGNGSAKVIAHLGVNNAAMAVLKDHLQKDPSGLKAAVYLGQLEAKFSTASTNNLAKRQRQRFECRLMQ